MGPSECLIKIISVNKVLITEISGWVLEYFSSIIKTKTHENHSTWWENKTVT